MDSVLEDISEWLKRLLIDAVTGSLAGVFDSMNEQVGEVAEEIGTSPQAFAPGVFSMIRNASDSVILPIAGMILTFVACYELIQMVVGVNNMAHPDSWLLFRWIFKTAAAALILSNTWNITMAIFDLTQHVIEGASGLISGETAVSAEAFDDLTRTLEAMEAGELLGVYLQCFLINIGMWILSRIVFVIIYGRMIEIYLMISLSPIPLATLTSREQGQMGQNFLRSLAALGFQGFLIMICVAIYAVLIQGISFSTDLIASIWGILGYTILLCFTLFKTGSLSKSIFNAH